MSTCFFKASRRASPLLAPHVREGFKGLVCRSIRLTLPFNLMRLSSLVIDLLETLIPSAKSLHHLCHSLLLRSKLLVMPTFRRGGDYARVLVIGLILEFPQPALKSASY